MFSDAQAQYRDPEPCRQRGHSRRSAAARSHHQQQRDEVPPHPGLHAQGGPPGSPSQTSAHPAARTRKARLSVRCCCSRCLILRSISVFDHSGSGSASAGGWRSRGYGRRISILRPMCRQRRAPTMETMLTVLMSSGVPIGLSGVTEGLIPDGAEGRWAILVVLAVLALLDSTSFGTLLIPVWLLMAPGRCAPDG